MINSEQFQKYEHVLIATLIVVISIFLLKSKWSPLQGSSESSEFIWDKLDNYEKCTSAFKTMEELAQADISEQPVPGSLVECARKWVIFDHWAVYIGHNVKEGKDADINESFDIREGFVIHLIPNGEKGPEIRMDKLKDVVKDSRCRVNDLKWAALERDLNPRSNEAIVKSALAEFEKFKQGKIEYDLLKFNCEHFATLCAFGTHFSEQASNALTKTYGNLIGETVSSVVHYWYDNNNVQE